MRANRRVWAAATALGATLAWVRWRPFRVAVEGESMAPLLEPGDWLLAVRSPIGRGAIVVVEHPERPGFELVKRVAGEPGDTVGAFVLPEDRYWVVGERPEASSDSRWFGPVPASSIRGHVVLRYGPGLRRLRRL